MGDEFFGSMHVRKSDLHIALMQRDPDLHIAGIVAAILDPCSIAPEIAVQEHIPRPGAAFKTGKHIAAKGLARLKHTGASQRRSDPRWAEI